LKGGFGMKIKRKKKMPENKKRGRTLTGGEKTNQ
jgi:hypothetical protein